MVVLHIYLTRKQKPIPVSQYRQLYLFEALRRIGILIVDEDLIYWQDGDVLLLGPRISLSLQIATGFVVHEMF